MIYLSRVLGSSSSESHFLLIFSSIFPEISIANWSKTCIENLSQKRPGELYICLYVYSHIWYICREFFCHPHQSHVFSWYFLALFLKFSSRIEVKSVSTIRHRIVPESSLEVSEDLSGAIWRLIGPILRGGEDQWRLWSVPDASRTCPRGHFGAQTSAAGL